MRTARTVSDRDEQLLGEIARRNWIILAVLTLTSLPWRTTSVTLGILGGGLVAIGGYYWLHRSLRQLLETPQPGGSRKFRFGYIVRLGSLAAALLLLITVVKVNPVGLALGLSVVVINIGWTTIKRSF
jgi:hypothetical protein